VLQLTEFVTRVSEFLVRSTWNS